jgi:hypothetical protein
MSRVFHPGGFRGTVSRLFPVVVLALSLTPTYAGSPLNTSGAVKGVVEDVSGQPRMGAVVLLFNRQDRLVRRALTNGEGGFAFGDLVPDVYSVRVTLASFLPALKSNILVQAGKLRLLEVNLSTLFSSIQLLPVTNGDARALMSDDWKWVLRTGSSTRPVLRILPRTAGTSGSDTPEDRRDIFGEMRGILKVSTGDSLDGNTDGGDLGTAFALATSLYGLNHLKISGNVGYGVDSGLPSAGIRTSYSHDFGNSNPEISVTMRQFYIPNRMGTASVVNPGVAGPGMPNGVADSSLPPLRMISLSSSDRAQISDSIDIIYGFELDSVSFIQRLHYLSPYARLTWTGLGGKIDMTYTSGNPRPGLGSDDRGSELELNRDLEALSLIPRIGLRDDQTQVQRGDDYEISYSTAFGTREYRISGFRQHVSNAALRLSNAGSEFSGDLMPDLYSNSSIFDAGSFTSMGYTASITQHLGEHAKVTVFYGSSDNLTTDANTLSADTADDLRKILRPVRRGQVTLRASAVVPRTGTRLSGSYQFTDYNTINPAQIYSTQPMSPVPGLNFSVRQPIPASFGLPWRVEATADIRNVLAQGYLPIAAADGRQLRVVENPRSFRGGLAFIF